MLFIKNRKNPNNINRYCLVVLHHNNLITEGNCIQTVRNYYAGNTCIAARILSAVFAYLSSVGKIEHHWLMTVFLQ